MMPITIFFSSLDISEHEVYFFFPYLQDNAIVVWFSNRAGSVDTFAGTSAISYEVQCNDLPSGGVDRTAVNNLAAK